MVERATRGRNDMDAELTSDDEKDEKNEASAASRSTRGTSSRQAAPQSDRGQSIADGEPSAGGRKTRSGRVAPRSDPTSSEEDDAEYSSRKNGRMTRGRVSAVAKKRKHGSRTSHESSTDNAAAEKMDGVEEPTENGSENADDQEASTSTAGNEGRRKRAVQSEAELEMDKKKRLEFLLKQSEDFARMMTSGGAANKSPAKGGRKKPVAVRKQLKDHRHKRPDTEEDEEEKMEVDAFCRYEKTPNFIKGGEMRDYQIRGLNWLISLCETNINGILADEMGLGKTLQTISLLGYFHFVRRSDKPDIIIVPKSTISNWLNEFKRWCPDMVAVSLIGDPETRKEFMKKSVKHRDWDVLVTSYDFAFREGSFLRKFLWGYVVIDEAHRIKNEQSVLAKAVRTFTCSRRLLLTGTPLQNNLHELWALLNFLLPDIFQSADDFDGWFNEKSCVMDMSLVERLHTILRPFLLRRVKAEVEKNLPPKTEIKLSVPLTEMQRTWYRNVLMKEISVLNTGGASCKYSSLFNILMHLRKVCNHPYLFNGAEPGPPYNEKLIIDNCGKMLLLDKLLFRLKENGHRVLIFSQMTRVLDILEDYCGYKNYDYCRLDGSTAHEDREEAIQGFNAPKSSKFLFLLSTRAGGLGINLTSADTVIIYDSDWNPQVDLQAMDRVHRIGQTKPVTVFRLLTENTVEERIIERAERKMRLDVMVIQSGRLVDASNKLDKDDILKMIRNGANSIIHSSASTITDEDIDTILARGKQKTDETNKKMAELTEENLKGLTYDFVEKDFFSFEGEDYRSKQNLAKEESELQWIELPKRERRQINAHLNMREAGSLSRDSPPYMPHPKIKRPSIPRPRVFNLLDIQFPPKRLVHLLEREQFAYKKAIGFKVDSDPRLEEAVRLRQEAEQAKIDNVQPLTPAEQAEKQMLLKSSFHEWKRNDFTCLMRGLDIFGTQYPEKIAPFIESKSPEEVKRYLAHFLKNYHTLGEAPRIAARIAKGIAFQERQRQRREAVKQKVLSVEFPEFSLKIPYPPNYAKSQTGLTNAGNVRVVWLEDEDRFLVWTYAEACDIFPDDGEPMYNHIRDTIRSAPNFKFDYMMKGITSDRVKERLDTLLTWIVREIFPKPAAPPKTSSNQEQVSPTDAPVEPQALSEAYKKLMLTPQLSTVPNGTKKMKLSESPTTFTLKHVDLAAGKFVMSPQSSSSSSQKLDSAKKKSGSKPVPEWARPKAWNKQRASSSKTSSDTSDSEVICLD